MTTFEKLEKKFFGFFANPNDSDFETFLKALLTTAIIFIVIFAIALPIILLDKHFYGDKHFKNVKKCGKIVVKTEDVNKYEEWVD
ncbi:hypothetical protein AGMMS49592_0630 [Endomicrobiia bacterium]|nr:hypothetical protein AGMMS49592_0630 [Endomicrobiia bacterium]